MDDGKDEVIHKCGNLLGHKVVLGELQRLQLGGVIIQAVHGVCSQCGEPIHWSLSEVMLQELIEHVLRTRQGDL